MPYLLDDNDVVAIRRLLDRVHGLNGPGVTNAPDGISIGFNRDRRGQTASVGRSGVAHQMFAVLLTEDGGSAGDASTQCSFTYTVKTLDAATTLGTVMTPDKQRPTVGAMLSGGGLVGAGYYDTTSTFVLVDANEHLDVC